MDLIEEFLRHNSMMNDRLLSVCRNLDAEQLSATVAGTFGPIGATWVHIANAQLGYVPRYVSPSRPDPLAESPFPGWTAVTDRIERGNRLLEETAGRAHESHEIQIHGDDPPGTWTMPASLLLLQAVNHGTEHRCQISTILTQLGIEPPPLDGWTYLYESGHIKPVDLET